MLYTLGNNLFSPNKSILKTKIANIKTQISIRDLNQQVNNNNDDTAATTTMGDPRFMILNLKRRDDRWRCTSKEFRRRGIQPTRINAVDAVIKFAPNVRKQTIQNLPELSATQKYSLLDDTGINTGHLATFLTHISALRAIVTNNLEIGCIFEDDIALVDNFLDRFNSLTQELPSNWDLLVLSMYCHAGWSTCKLNTALQPISTHLKPVLAFMSGAGYCLNARSAQLVLDTIPCTNGPCGVAIDGYLSSLAQRQKIVAYRAIDLPVIIPQDLMNHKSRTNSVDVDDKDCYSRFDSDIAAWWKPDQKRRGKLCVIDSEQKQQNHNAITLHIQSKSSAMPTDGEMSVNVIEGDILKIHNSNDIFHTWQVRNVDNTMFVYMHVNCVIVVSEDLWRGKSVTFYNVGLEKHVDVWWSEETKRSWLSTALRGSSSSKKPIKHGTIQAGKSFHIFLPDFQRSLVVVPEGMQWIENQFETVLLVQSLKARCLKSQTIPFFRSKESIGQCESGYQLFNKIDIKGHDLTAMSVHSETLKECCQVCNKRGRKVCGGVVYRGDMDGMNCYLKDVDISSDDHVVMDLGTTCIRQDG